jgi:glycosyltransferase involved in cell wall biosynthesis
MLLPFQPFEELPMALAAADVLVAILEPDASVFAVPSKVLTYLCARRPLLLAVPAENLAARIVESVGAGIVVSPTDVTGFLRASEKLISDTELCRTMAENGYGYALTEFNIEKVAGRFGSILGKL